jgi:hypothetical protein
MSPETRGWLVLIGESITIFAVSILVLYVIYTLIFNYERRGTTIVVVNMKGYVFMVVGVLYVAFGFFLTRLTRMPGLPRNLPH